MQNCRTRKLLWDITQVNCILWAIGLLREWEEWKFAELDYIFHFSFFCMCAIAVDQLINAVEKNYVIVFLHKEWTSYTKRYCIREIINARHRLKGINNILLFNLKGNMHRALRLSKYNWL